MSYREYDEPGKPPPEDFFEVEECENCGERDCECEWEDEAYDLAGDR